MKTPWRYRCPKGHFNLHIRTRNAGWYCGTCERRYETVVDQLEGMA